jgi:hypothetical protein
MTILLEMATHLRRPSEIRIVVTIALLYSHSNQRIDPTTTPPNVEKRDALTTMCR